MEDRFSSLRERMVLEQLVRRGIRDERVLEAFRKVPRHFFVPSDCREEAYEDRPISIGQGQTISQPYIVAFMLQSLALQPEMKVLEVGTGSGYQTALLAQMGVQVYSIERLASLAQTAVQRLKELGMSSAKIQLSDGSLGWPQEAPFDAIVVSAAVPQVPERLIAQLKEGGRMGVPVGEALSQSLMLVQRRQGVLETQSLCGCLFVPLIGEEGW